MTPAEQKEKPVMYAQEEISELEDEKVMMKHFASREPFQKQVRFEEEHIQIQDQGLALGAARVRRRPVFDSKKRQ